MIEQYCSVCKAVLVMEAVPTEDGEDDGVLWLRCPRCQGYLPKFRTSSEDASPGVAPEAPASAPLEGADEPADALSPSIADEAASISAPLDDLDYESAVPYRPWGSYPVGSVVHHLAWDDYGLVLAKEVLPGNRRTVKVHFTKAGIVRLIEESSEGP